MFVEGKSVFRRQERAGGGKTVPGRSRLELEAPKRVVCLGDSEKFANAHAEGSAGGVPAGLWRRSEGGRVRRRCVCKALGRSRPASFPHVPASPRRHGCKKGAQLSASTHCH